MSATDTVIAQWQALAAAGGEPRRERLFRGRGPQHAAIADALVRVQPTSLLEIGCSVGVNLAAAAALGVPRLCGIDIDAAAIEYAAERVPATLMVGDLRALLAGMEPRSWDVTLSCYTLAYIAPDEIEEALRALVAVTQRRMILAEPGAGAVGTPTVWSHDYIALGTRCGLRPRFMHPIPDTQGLTAVWIWEVLDA